MPSTLPPLVRFADFEVNLRAGELRREGSKVRLQEQPFSLLTVLLESAGEVVTREELRKRLWSEDTFVDFDHRLAVAVSKLRDALRDSAEKPLFVETVGRRGYRFVGQLESADSLPADSRGGVGETSLPSDRPPAEGELPEVAPLGSTRSRTSRLTFLFSVGFAVLLGVIVLPKFLHTSICETAVFESPEPRDPSSAKSWPGFDCRLPRIIPGGCTHHEISVCTHPKRSSFRRDREVSRNDH